MTELTYHDAMASLAGPGAEPLGLGMGKRELITLLAPGATPADLLYRRLARLTVAELENRLDALTKPARS